MKDHMNIDTHIHLGGAIPTSCIWQIIKDKNLTYLAQSYKDVINAMVCEEPSDFEGFLHKFKILDHIPWDEDTIDFTIKSICDSLQKQHIDYCWLDFSINKYMEHMKWHKHEAIEFIADRFNNYMPGRVGLILSLKYESLETNQKQYAKLIDHEASELLFGIDLVGDERYFNKKRHKEILTPWIKAGKMVRAHVGETGPVENVRAAIEIGVSNIAHGLNITECQNTINMAKDNDISFDLGITSNYMTKVVTAKHPCLEMHKHGLKITIGSDDPVVCRTTLKNEYNIVRELFGNQRLLDFKRNAVEETKKFTGLLLPEISIDREEVSLLQSSVAPNSLK